VKGIRERLGANAVLCQIPIGSQDEFVGMVDLVAGCGYVWDSDDKDAEWETVPLDQLKGRFEFSLPTDAEWIDRIPELRQEMLETALAMDDDAFMHLVETGEFDQDVLKACIRKGSVSGKLIPVLCGSSFKNKGVQQLLDAVIDYLPFPGENGGISLVDADGKIIGEQEVRDDAPARALAFKVINDQFGSSTFIRIYSGVIKKGDSLTNVTRSKKNVSAGSSKFRRTSRRISRRRVPVTSAHSYRCAKRKPATRSAIRRIRRCSSGCVFPIPSSALRSNRYLATSLTSCQRRCTRW
jgi:elongation factor G